ncbi:hypothetical protein OXX59_002849 [Metschnikowia pulcherrima]
MPSHGSFSAEEADDELFARFSHDVAQCIKAIQFLAAQGDRISAKYWPKLFQVSSQVASQWELLLGENSIDFEEKSQFYAAFDSRQADSAGFMTVHPKECTNSVPSLQEEVHAYKELISTLEKDVLALIEPFQRSLAAKCSGICIHLNHIQTRLKLRETYYEKCAKLEKKVSKLEKKLSQAEIKDSGAISAELDSVAANLASASAKYTALNTKLKTTLPESLLLVEEFVSTLVKWTLSQKNEIAAKMNQSFSHMGQSFGLLDTRENKTVKGFEEISDQWESAATPTRLRVESLLLAIYTKNPTLFDEEISGKDSTSAMTKAWSKLTSKKEKHHKVKPKDRENGIFHDHQMADPLRSYIRYHDPDMNLSDIYHPPKTAKSTEKTRVLPKPLPPPLPPRDETSLIRIKPAISPKFPNMAHSQNVSPNVPQTPPPSADSWTANTWFASSPLASSSGKTPVRSPAIESQFSFASEQNQTVSSSVHDSDTLFSEMAHEKLVKMYNLQKNEITEAPIMPSVFAAMSRELQNADQSTSMSHSATAKLLEIRRVYEEMKLRGSGNHVTVQNNFAGEQSGDICVKAGDEFEVLFDLQQSIMTYNKGGDNWVLCASAGPEESLKRIGFAPNTCFKHVV